MSEENFAHAIHFKCSELFHPDGKGCINLIHLDGKWSESVTISAVDVRTGRPIHLHFEEWSEVQAFIDALSYAVTHYAHQ